MGRTLACIMLSSAFFAGVASGQTSSSGSADSVRTAPAKSSPEPSRVYWGGTLGFNFWNDYTSIRVEPLVGYKATPQLSVGGKVRYEYFKDNRRSSDFTSHNYGGSVFSRYRLVPQLYAHAEFAYVSYDYPRGREGVPFLLLGGGVSQPLGGRSWATAEVLFDVIQDDNSPYEDWEAIVSVGVGVGF